MNIFFEWHKIDDDEKKAQLMKYTPKQRKKLTRTIQTLMTDVMWLKHFNEYKRLIRKNSIMVVDVETTGFAHTSKIVQLSFAVYDDILDYKDTSKIYDYIIRQDENMVIPSESTKIHGITDEIARMEGVDLVVAIDKFEEQLKNVSKIVGHNINFDINIIKNELIRVHKLECKLTVERTNTYCTMRNTKNILKLLTVKGTIKNPKLSELYSYLFNEDMTCAHNAKYDVLNTAKCYFECMKREKEVKNTINVINKAFN